MNGREIKMGIRMVSGQGELPIRTVRGRGIGTLARWSWARRVGGIAAVGMASAVGPVVGTSTILVTSTFGLMGCSSMALRVTRNIEALKDEKRHSLQILE
jgi:hypothetical protein